MGIFWEDSSRPEKGTPMNQRSVNMNLIVTDEQRILFSVTAQEPNDQGETVVHRVIDMNWQGCKHYTEKSRGEFVMAAGQQMLSILHGQFLEIQCPEVENPDLDIRTLWEEDTRHVG